MKRTSENTSKSSITGALAAIAASSCCIPPVIAAIAGIWGFSASLSWLEQLRPYLIGLAVAAIGYAWYGHLGPKQAGDCGCDIDAKPKWYQTKGYLVVITLFAALATTFPYYSGVFYSDAQAGKTINVKERNVAKAALSIEGMTCTGCEHHVNKVLSEREGVLRANSSYQKGRAKLRFDKTQTSIDQLANAVEDEAGYKVTDKNVFKNN